MNESERPNPDTTLLDQRIEAEFNRRSLEKGAGGGHSGGVDAWQQSVENRLGSLDTRLEGFRSDMDGKFRWTWAGFAAGFVILIGGFGWLVDILFTMQSNIQTQLGDLSVQITELASKLP